MSEPRDTAHREGRNEHPSRGLDRELDRALGTLPREKASADFTSRVMARLDEAPESPPRFPFPWLDPGAGHGARGRLSAAGWAAAAAVAALALVVLVALWPAEAPSPGSEIPPGELQAAMEAPGSEPGSQMPRGASAPPSAAPAAALSGTPPSRSDSEPARQQLAATLEQMQREHLRLQRDLRDLRQLAEGSRRIYLGGDETLDLVLELDAPPGVPSPARLERTGGSGRPPGGGDGALRYY